MATINIYEQYFEAELTANGVDRHAALVMLIADSEAGRIRYEAAATFFPHNSEDDFAVSYDAYFSEALCDTAGRRSKKRDKAYLEVLREHIDRLAEQAGGKVFWDKPLRDARYE